MSNHCVACDQEFDESDLQVISLQKKGAPEMCRTCLTVSLSAAQELRVTYDFDEMLFKNRQQKEAYIEAEKRRVCTARSAETGNDTEVPLPERAGEE